MCSPYSISCRDLEVVVPETTEGSTDSPANDGAIDETTGECIGSLYIFSGSVGTCRPSGVDTLFFDCCGSPQQNIIDSFNRCMSTYGAAFDPETLMGKCTTKGGNGLCEFEPVTSLRDVEYAEKQLPMYPYCWGIAIVENFEWFCQLREVLTNIYTPKSLCHNVGKYCTQRWKVGGSSICVQSKRVSCCFESKLSRIIHEQGRKQLTRFAGNEWGTPENPDCYGFTADDFAALDFSKIDLSEWIAELTGTISSEVQQKMQETVNESITGQ
jgi:conjugal transfer mating pair stabilization protein TraN